MFSVWQSVKVRTATKDHEREGQAGTVYATSPTHQDEVQVCFDTDQTVMAVKLVDLEML